MRNSYLFDQYKKSAFCLPIIKNSLWFTIRCKVSKLCNARGCNQSELYILRTDNCYFVYFINQFRDTNVVHIHYPKALTFQKLVAIDEGGVTRHLAF